MGRPSKGGRKKKLWDVGTTVRCLDMLLGEEEDPREADPGRSFLHFVRVLCRSLDANMPAITAFDRLLRLMRDKAAPVRRYAHEVNDAFTAYAPLAPRMNDLLQRGEADELWKLWFFACEMPKRLRRTVVGLDRLLYAGQQFMPVPYVVPGFQLAVARTTVLLGLQSHGYDLDQIALILDPAGHEDDSRAARDRVRKEARRLKVFMRSQRDGKNEMLASALEAAPGRNEDTSPDDHPGSGSTGKANA